MGETWQKAGVEYVVKDSTRSGVSSVTRGLKRLETASRGVVASVGRLARGFAALAGVGSIAGVTYLVKQQMSAADAVGKLSDRLEISTEALSAWGHAAELTGTSVEALHKGLETFTRRIGEAQMGLGEARHGLEAIGVTADELVAQGPEQAFVTVAEAISGIEDASKRAQVAYTFFGRQGVGLMNLLMQGADGIEAMRKEAEKLGITFSRLDAAQIEAANDAITRAKAAMGGLARQVAIDVAPYIEAFADQFAEATAEGQNFGDTIITTMEAVACAVDTVRQGIDAVSHALGRIPGAAEDIGYWTTLNKEIGKATAAEYEFAMHQAGRRPWKSRATLTNPFGKDIHFGGESSTPLDPAMYEEIRQSVAVRFAETMAAEQPTGSDGGSAKSEIERYFTDLRDKARQRRVESQNDYLADRADSWLGGETDFTGVEDQRRAAEVLDTTTHAMTDQKKAAEDAGDAVEDYRVRVAPLMSVTDLATVALEDMAGVLTDIAFEFESAGQAAEQFAAALARMMVQELVMRPLVQGVGKEFNLYGSEQHAGGIAGTGPRRALPAAAVALARRFHGGGEALDSDEIVAVLQQREVVLTERDANRFRLLGLLDAAGRPTFHAGGTVGGASVPASGSATRPNVNVQIDNQSGTAIDEPDVGVEVDPENYILSVVLRSANQGGPIRDLVRRGR